MKYQSYLVAAGRWAIGVRADGTLESLAPVMYWGNNPRFPEHAPADVAPKALPGQKIYLYSAQQRTTVVIGVYSGDTAGEYIYRTYRGPNLHGESFIIICD